METKLVKSNLYPGDKMFKLSATLENGERTICNIYKERKSWKSDTYSGSWDTKESCTSACLRFYMRDNHEAA